MRFIQLTSTRFKHVCRRHYEKIAVIIGLLLTGSSFSEVIPIATKDETQSGENVVTTMEKILVNDIIPFIQIIAGVVIVWYCIASIWGGVKESQELKKMDPLKHALIVSGILLVIGGSLIYLLGQIKVPTS